MVGRTGSGKSSLMLALFRLIDVTAGRVLLDGLDVAGIGLDALRRQLAIIPQVRVGVSLPIQQATACINSRICSRGQMASTCKAYVQRCSMTVSWRKLPWPL